MEFYDFSFLFFYQVFKRFNDPEIKKINALIKNIMAYCEMKIRNTL